MQNDKGFYTLSTTIGNDGRRDIGLNVSGPIIKDKFYAGISYKHQQKDGFIKTNRKHFELIVSVFR